MPSLRFRSYYCAMLAICFGAQCIPILGEPNHPIVPGVGSQASLTPELKGRLLLGELNCVSCHDAGPRRQPIKAKGGPRLADAAARINHRYMLDFIADPIAIKPGTTMPDALSHLPEKEKQTVARAIVHYLISIGQDAPSSEPVSKGSKAQGRELYHSVGCVACHSPEDPLSNSVPLGSLKQKYTLEELVGFLRAPLTVRPDGRMPDMQLGHFEAVDVATYLLRDQEELPPPFELQPDLAEAGEAYFAEYGCAACHKIDDVRSQARSPLSELRVDRGCLSGDLGSWPHFPLNEAQKTALRAALSRKPPALDVEQQIRLSLTRFNCIGCHQRGEFEGIPEARREYFTTDNPNLGEQGRIPPPLTAVGAKLKPDWLREVLVHGESVRPYMKTRMPQFGEANVIQLVQWLSENDTLPPTEITRVEDEKLARQSGRKLAGDKGLNCISCHTFRNQSAAPIRALDLTRMAERLQENWFHHYMKDPQRFRPLTIMPTYWPNGNSTLKGVLDGNASKQIDALWQYLSEGRNVGRPAGLVLEPLPLVVADEAVMLRRRYPGIGKRGIGVGYPRDINLSFDAGQMRLGSIWRGKFIEASPVWRGQGAGTVRIIGTDVVRFPAGPAFALLKSREAPWPEDDANKAEGFQFKGYTLDEKRRPIFRYEFHSISIRDQFLDLKDSAGKAFFRRTLTFDPTPSLANLWLRLAVDKEITEMSQGSYKVGPLLELQLPKDGRIRSHPEGEELILSVQNESELIIEYHW